MPVCLGCVEGMVGVVVLRLAPTSSNSHAPPRRKSRQPSRGGGLRRAEPLLLLPQGEGRGPGGAAGERGGTGAGGRVRAVCGGALLLAVAGPLRCQGLRRPARVEAHFGGRVDVGRADEHAAEVGVRWARGGEHRAAPHRSSRSARGERLC